MPLPILRAALEAWPTTKFMQVYGMTEFGGVVTILDDDAHRDTDHPERLVSAGRPIPGVEVRVVDPATLEDVEPGHGRRAVVPHRAVDARLPRPARGDAAS